MLWFVYHPHNPADLVRWHNGIIRDCISTLCFSLQGAKIPWLALPVHVVPLNAQTEQLCAAVLPVMKGMDDALNWSCCIEWTWTSSKHWAGLQRYSIIYHYMYMYNNWSEYGWVWCHYAQSLWSYLISYSVDCYVTHVTCFPTAFYAVCCRATVPVLTLATWWLLLLPVARDMDISMLLYQLCMRGSRG